MSERFFLRLSSVRSNVAACFVACLLVPAFLALTAPDAFAAPPTPRIRSGENALDAPVRSGSARVPRAGVSGRRGGSAPSRRVQERNDGSLPPTNDEFVSLDELAQYAGNWLDSAISDSLHELVLDAARERRSRWPAFQPLREEKGGDRKIRRVEFGRITMYTDVPSNAEVDLIPEVLDAAVPLICDFFHVDRALFENWHVDAFLMRDIDLFIQFGALDGPPLFLYGYSDRDRIFAKDQKVDYYNRFLLTHELVHTFMHEYFGDLRPRWYSEGAAEYVALHSWSAKKGLRLAQIPVSEEDYPGFGRLRQIQEILRTNHAPTILDIMDFEPRDYVHVSTYAWSWAFVMFLYNSPKYHDVAELLPYWMLVDDPNSLFVDAIGDRWAELEYDWAAFLDQIDYSYDFKAAELDFDSFIVKEPTEAELRKGVVVDVDTSRGWQPTGVTLKADRKYKLTLGGRFDFFLESAGKTFSFEGTGATCEYSGGRPVGRVRAVVAPNPDKAVMAQVYGYLDGGKGGDSRNGVDGFRFNAFQNMRHTRFGVDGESDASGFSAEKRAELVANESAKRDANRAGARKGETPGTARRDSEDDAESYPLYNALYPWSESVDFAANSTTLVPDSNGSLFLRVNGPARNLKRNRGSVKVQVKLVD